METKVITVVTFVMCVSCELQNINTPGYLVLISLVSLCVCNP